MMITFPNIMPPSYPLKEKYEDNTIRSTMEDGSVITRRKFTRSRATFTLQYDALPIVQYTALIDFFRNTTFMGAKPFEWTHPETKKKYTVRLKELGDFELSVIGIYKGSVTLEEV